jgi:hypothetical protein
MITVRKSLKTSVFNSGVSMVSDVNHNLKLDDEQRAERKELLALGLLDFGFLLKISEEITGHEFSKRIRDYSSASKAWEVAAAYDMASRPDYSLEQYKNLPDNVQKILEQYALNDATYEDCNKLIEELEKVGFTCDYGLCAECYDLRFQL